MTTLEVARLVVIVVSGSAVAAFGWLLARHPEFILRGPRDRPPTRPHRAADATRRVGIATVAAGLVIVAAGVIAGLAARA